jgi:polar amino acid transport system permease protein
MFDNVGHFLSVLATGLLPTVELTIAGILVATLIAFVAGLAGTARSRLVRIIVRIYVEGWRGTSEVVQLFWVYFAVPLLIGFQLVPFWAGVLVLGLNHGAYGAEIVRGAVAAVPRAQHEGAIALGFPPAQRMRRVILPQAVVDMLPPFNTLYIQLLKATSLVSLINVDELTYQGKQILEPVFPAQMPLILTLMLLMYLVLAILITTLMRFLERIGARMLGRRPGKLTATLSKGVVAADAADIGPGAGVG